MYSHSTDIIDALGDLTTEREEYASALALLPDGVSDDAKEMLMQHTGWSPEQEEEWVLLGEYNNIGEDSSSEWTDGTVLIPVSGFTDYVQQLVEEIGDLPRNLPTYVEIDWAATAENLKCDYSVITLDEEYCVRSA